jgi:hypothetical protein
MPTLTAEEIHAYKAAREGLAKALNASLHHSNVATRLRSFDAAPPPWTAEAAMFHAYAAVASAAVQRRLTDLRDAAMVIAEAVMSPDSRAKTQVALEAQIDALVAERSKLIGEASAVEPVLRAVRALAATRDGPPEAREACLQTLSNVTRDWLQGYAQLGAPEP